MAKIRLLDEHTINKIAAGEVIENPASVVKELMENALDAGSTEICVEIAGGGRQLIRITDNGCGMSSDDAILCLERHATSKIRQVDDIFDIFTMGFRGEAIPSIASISKFTILTTPQKENEKNEKGTMVIVEGGKLLSSSPAARSPGTTMEVKSLFFNVPARKKFQRSPAFDTQEIVKVVTLLSLAHPHIKFELISDQKEILKTPVLPADHTFQEHLGCRIENLFGEDFYHQLVPIAIQEDTLQISGFIGVPSFHRKNRSGQYIFVNQRAIQSPLISFAIKDGYNTMLPANRYPVFVIHLQIPGSLIDVNVHPQKKEIRFRHEYQLKESIIKAIQKTHQPESSVFTPAEETIPFAINPLPPLPSFEKPKEPEPTLLPQFYYKQTVKPVDTFFDDIPPKKILPRIIAYLPGYLLLDPVSVTPPLFQGNLKNEGFVLLNQKGALARIYYEKMLHEKTPSPKEGQSLLIPFTKEFSLYEATLLKEHLEALNKMGFSIKEFGERTFNIDALPPFCKEDELEDTIIAILHGLQDYQDTRQPQKEKERALALATSQQSSHMKRRLSFEESSGLIQQLLDCETPSKCPLGRPIVLHFSSEMLAKFFAKGCSHEL